MKEILAWKYFYFFLIGSDKKKFALLFWKEYISAESPG